MSENPEITALKELEVPEALSDTEAHLLTQLLAGDPEAGRRFVLDHYPGIYRHLLYLTGQRESAEDLTQETFFQAWRHLGKFEGRAPLRHWLHRIAHREFLRALRSRRAQVSLEAAGDLPAPHSEGWTEAVELRELIQKLPLEQREAVALHYLEGYSCDEIARIVGAPVGTVKFRLSAARDRLERELDEGDLAYLNEQPLPLRQWAWLPLDRIFALEARLAMFGVQAFGVQAFGPTVAGPNAERLAPERRPNEEDAMERREFLRQAAVGAAGLMLPEKEVVDGRLTRKVSLAITGMALADVCGQLEKETGVRLTAGNSVADEKVTLFCQKLPLREVMRQLSRPFGYAWLRSGPATRGAGGGSYRYELAQDLRSQLLEEELRNRDRHESLLSLEKDLERYRPYLHLTPDEALEQSKTAGPGEKLLLEQLAGNNWGALQMYPRLTAQELAALRAGHEITYTEAPRAGELPRPPHLKGGELPPEIARGVLQSLRWRRLIQGENGWEYTPQTDLPGALPPAAIPEARAQVRLRLDTSDLGQFGIMGAAALFTIGKHGGVHWYGSSSGTVGAGTSPTARKPNNARANANLARDPSLRAPVTLEPEAGAEMPAGGKGAEVPTGTADPSPVSSPRLTTADVLEEIHRKTGMPIVADFYTRLHKPEAVAVQGLSLFEALNRLADTMGLRWRREDGWLQFRSTTYYDDRLKEVPNRLLTRWSTARRQHRELSLDHLCEIISLTDAQLDGQEMAEGAREIWGLQEWDLARTGMARPHLRYLASLTPEQRREATEANGLSFTRMTLAQQQQFIAQGMAGDALQSLEELTGAVFRVEYSQPGWFQWGQPGWSGYSTRWVIALEPGRHGRRVLRPTVRERTRRAALAAVRRIPLPLRQALLEAARRTDPRVEPDQERFDASQIFPTRLDLTLVYIPGATNARPIFMLVAGSQTSGYDNSGVPRRE